MEAIRNNPVVLKYCDKLLTFLTYFSIKVDLFQIPFQRRTPFQYSFPKTEPSFPSAISFTRTVRKVRDFKVTFAVSGSGSRATTSIKSVTAVVKALLVEFGSSFVEHS